MYDSVYVARQPIFDRSGDVFAYELLYRNGLANQVSDLESEHEAAGDDASIQVASCGVLAAAQGDASGKRLFINFTGRCILERLALGLPSDLVVVEVLENVRLTKEIYTALWDLKKEGYAIAVDDYQGQTDREELLKMADYVKVDVLGLQHDEIRKLSDKLHNMSSCSLLAEKVDDRYTLDLVRQCGFDYFQGFFFALPENLGQRKLRSGALTRLQVLEKLQDPDVDLFELVDSIQGDVSLSYRLLRYIRATAFSLPYEVKSIRQAALLLGTNKLKNWLRLLLLSDLSQGPAKGELPFISLARARFFEYLAKEHESLPLNPGEAYLLGLFSLLEAMIEVPMAEIVKPLALPKKVMVSLLRRQETAAGRLLDLAEALEHGNWEASDAMAEEMGLTTAKVVQAYHLGQTTAQYFLSNNS